MNAIFKSIITNPFTIGGTILGAGVVTGAVIYVKHRPKTDAEIELEKLKESNAQELRLKEAENKKCLEEVEKQEETKRQAKEQEEKTKRLELDLEKLKEQNAESERKWEREKNAPQGYWDREVAKVRSTSEERLREEEFKTQKEIARLHAEAAKYEAEANAKAAKEAAYVGLRRQESADRTEAAKWNVAANAISSMVSGKVS